MIKINRSTTLYVGEKCTILVVPLCVLESVCYVQYLNIREYDVEETDLLKYWDKTYLFIKVGPLLIDVVDYHVTIAENGHGSLKKFYSMVKGCVLRTAGRSII